MTLEDIFRAADASRPIRYEDLMVSDGHGGMRSRPGIRGASIRRGPSGRAMIDLVAAKAAIRDMAP